MDETTSRRLWGLKSLVHDGVERGANLVERHHRAAAATPFRVLEAIPPITAPTQVVRIFHDAVVTLTYGSIRTLNRCVKMVRPRR